MQVPAVQVHMRHLDAYRRIRLIHAGTCGLGLISLPSEHEALEHDFLKCFHTGDESRSIPEGWPDSPLEAPQLSQDDMVFIRDYGVQFVWGHDELDIDELNDLFELVRVDTRHIWFLSRWRKLMRFPWQ